MHAKEMILTGASLSLLAYWELGIGEIPLGLFSISHSTHALLFSSIILLKLIGSAVLISLGLRQLAGKGRQIVRALLHLPEASEKHSHPGSTTGNGAISARH